MCGPKLIAGALILLVAPIARSQDPATEQDSPRVTIDSGPIIGEWVDPEESVAAFKGIPFAAPPVGDLRWRPPRDPEPWKEARQTTSCGPECPQPEGMMAWWMGMITTSLGGDPALLPAEAQRDENCLYLNVWSTNLDASRRLPVMVWIHGGGYLLGTGSTPFYDGTSLARQGVVVVTLNYRLGALGFMAHSELTAESPREASGNYGFLDQIAALKWVQRNIGSFGGDPNTVTIFGESAGASSVIHLMTSPLAGGLFHRAIVQSFNVPSTESDKPQTRAFHGRLDLAGAERLGLKLAERTGVDGAGPQLEKLRALTAEEIVAASMIEPGIDFAPLVDGWVLPRPPLEVFRAGRQHDVPLMIGVTGNEGSTLLFEPPCASVEEYEGFVRQEFGDKAEALLEMYSPSQPDQCRPTRLRWFQNGCLTAARYLARTMEKVDSEAYLYLFSREPPGEGGRSLGAFHGSEIGFVFDTHNPAVWPTGPGDDSLTETMGRMWVQFATAGEPNGDGLPVWSPYSRAANRYMDLNYDPAERALSPEQIEALDRMEALFWK